MGFADNWTSSGKYNGAIKDIADTPRYSVLGNSVVIPCVRFIFNGITHAETEKLSKARGYQQI